MFNQIEAANTNTEQTLESVLADYRFTTAQREAIQHAASEILSNLPQSEANEFLIDLRSRIEAAREPVVHSHVQDITAAIRAITRKATGGKGRLDYYGYTFEPGSITDLVKNLAA